MKINACYSSREKLFAMLLCLALALPLAPAGAQDDGDVWSDDTWSDKNWTDNAWTDDGADVTETASPGAASPESAPETAPKAAAGEAPKAVSGEAPRSSAPKAAPKTQGMPNITTLINRGIGYVSQIGAVFGKTAGIRIGGTSVSAVAMLAIAKFFGNRAPPWVKGLLYLFGGTMVAGSSANIMQAIMQFLL